MITQKQLQNNLEIRAYNTARMHDVLSKVNNKITKQGDGCYTDLGPAYFDPITKRRDSVAIISTVPNQFLIKPYHVISAFESRALLTNLFRVCKFDVIRDSERARVTYFLQSVQDAHDFAFDPFIKVTVDRMKLFKEYLLNIKI